VYAPNVTDVTASQEEYSKFLIELELIIDDLDSTCKSEIIIGGDFNIALEQSDGLGPKKLYNTCIELVWDLTGQKQLKDSYRWIHDDKEFYTYAPMGNNDKNIYSRLDYIWMTQTLCENIMEAEDKWVDLTDHKVMVVQMGNSKKLGRGKGLWRHNDEINLDPDFISQGKLAIQQAVEEAEGNKRAKWEYIKYKLRQCSKRFSENKSKEKRKESKTLERRLAELEEDATSNLKEIQDCKVKLGALKREEDEKIIFRARAKYVEDNEKCTKYFYNRIKQNSRNSNIIDLEESGSKLSRDQISKEIYKFYSELYAHRETAESISLPDRLKGVMEDPDAGRDITIKELTHILHNKLNSGKSPGNDGLTVGIYKIFWSYLKQSYYDALMEAINKGELSTSQKQSVIRLIHKKGKDRNKIGDWRPISLINVDTKIFSRLITARLEAGLSKCIGREQHAYVPVYSIDFADLLKMCFFIPLFNIISIQFNASVQSAPPGVENAAPGVCANVCQPVAHSLFEFGCGGVLCAGEMILECAEGPKVTGRKVWRIRWVRQHVEASLAHVLGAFATSMRRRVILV
jgi:hypothetical protein